MVLNLNKPLPPINITCSIDLQPTKVTYGEGWEEELAKILRQQIDWEMLSHTLQTIGWISVKINHCNDEIIGWSRENINGRCEFLDTHWMFENPNDASHFILKWA